MGRPTIMGPARGEARKHWWQEKDASKAATAAWAAYDCLRQAQGYREHDHQRFACLYGNREMAGFLSSTMYARPIEDLKSRLPYNVVSEVIDARQSKICQSRPRSFNLVTSGGWTKKRKAKLRNKFIQGVYYENDVYGQAPQVFLDSEIIGDGVWQVYEGQDGRIKIERVLASEIYVDEAESKYGDPRQMYRVRPVAREVLLADPRLTAAQRKGIEDAAAIECDGEQFQGDMVPVLEAWHRPSMPTKDEAGDEVEHDGVYARSVRDGDGGATELHRGIIERFPFVFDKCRRPMMGFWGQPVAARLVGYQVAINRMQRRIDGSLKNAVVSLFVPEILGLKREDITNNPSNVYITKGPPNVVPTAVQASYVPRDYYEQLDRYRAGAMREGGVSDYDVSMVKPAGLNSGTALREHNAKSTERLSVRFQGYEQSIAVDLANAVVDLAANIARRRKKAGKDGELQGYKVRTPNQQHIEEIDFLDTELRPEDCIIQAWPVSQLPLSPEGQKQEMVEWMQLGLMSGLDFLREQKNPDTEGYVERMTAGLDDAQWRVDQMTEYGRYMQPVPYQDLDMSELYAKVALLRCERDRYPEKRLQMVRDYLLAITKLKQLAAQATAPQQPALPAAALPPPAPPPGMEPPPQLPGPMQAAA